jgi:hypothetical protein
VNDEEAAVVEETKVVRDQLVKSARKAQVLEIALVALAAASLVVIAGFSAWNTARLRDISRLLEENQVVAKEYNVGTARSSYESHRAIIDLQVCVSRAFLRLPDVREEEVLACFQPATPPPPDVQLPSEKNNSKKEPTTTTTGEKG